MKNEVKCNNRLVKFGYGLFETMKVCQGEVILLNEHLDRLYNSLNYFDFSFDIEKEDLRAKVMKYVTDLEYKAFRITVFDGGYHFSLRNIPYNIRDYEKGYNLKIAPVKRGDSFIYHHKTVNYMENIVLKNRVTEKGFDEVLFLDMNDYILECSTANIFFIAGSTLYTPDDELSFLSGITRKKVLQIADKMGYKVIEDRIKVDKLSDFDAVFITNSLMDLMPVVAIEDIEFEKGNKTFQKLKEEFSIF